MARCGLVRWGRVGCGLAVMVRCGLVRFGMVRFGAVWYGAVWHGRQGKYLLTIKI